LELDLLKKEARILSLLKRVKKRFLRKRVMENGFPSRYQCFLREKITFAQTNFWYG